MAAFVPVAEFFSQVYLVDLSPSLCEVARQRFERLGWKNITVVCQDARSFRLPEENVDPAKNPGSGADVVTMSYSLSMIPGKSSFAYLQGNHSQKYADYYSVVDSLGNLVKPSGLLGVCDFYGKAQHNLRSQEETLIYQKSKALSMSLLGITLVAPSTDTLTG